MVTEREGQIMLTSSEILVALRGMRAGGMLNRNVFGDWAVRVGVHFDSGVMSIAAIGSDNRVVKFIHDQVFGHSSDCAADLAFFANVKPEDRKFFPETEMDDDGFIIQERIVPLNFHTECEVTKHFPAMLMVIAAKYGIGDLHCRNWGIRLNADGSRNYENPVIFDVGYRFQYQTVANRSLTFGHDKKYVVRSVMEDYSCVYYDTWGLDSNEFWDSVLPSLVPLF